MQQETPEYYLVIRSGQKDYLPVDWSQTSIYEGEDLFSLKGIDTFTSKIHSIDLLREILNQKLITGDELFSSFEVLSLEKGNNHTIKEGPIFLEDEHVMSEGEFIEYIIANRHNRNVIDNVLAQTSLKETSSNLGKFQLILRNIDFWGDDIERLRDQLDTFKYLTYEEKRAICVRMSDYLLEKEAEMKKQKRLNDQVKVA